MALSQQIAKHRKALKISGSEAARRAGVHRLTWSAWEKGSADPEEHNYARIEETLCWTPGDVVRVRQGQAPTVIRGDVNAGEINEARAVLLAATPEEFVARFRGAEEVYLQGGDRAGADRWLRNALTAREEAIRAEATKRDDS
ncbi:MAG: helix-turn-helix transcriptional regulator [Umezawaea sp.]